MRYSAAVVVGGVVLSATLAVAVPPVGAQSQDLPPPPAGVLACGPRLAALVAPSAGRLVGAPDNAVTRLFRQGDTVLVDVGASSDLAIGTHFIASPSGRHGAGDTPIGFPGGGDHGMGPNRPGERTRLSRGD